MAKLIYRSLKTRPGRAARSVTRKRIRDENGGWKTVLTLDANSSSFEEDLRYVFSKNVAKARRENKRVLGSSDIAPPKR